METQSISEADHHHGRIRVLEVIGNASKGGMENFLKNFIANLPSHQFHVTCICPYESRFTSTLRELGVEEVYIAPIADDPAWRSIQLTMAVARLHQIDVLHAHMPKAHVLAGLAGCLLHKPVVATVHGMHVTAYELGVTKAVGSHLITNCQEAYTQALALGVPAGRVTLIRNGVDITLFTPQQSGSEFREKINLPPGTPLIGFVGRLDHEKGPDLFLRIADYIHHHRPDIHFVMVGDGAMRKKLLALRARLRLQQHVHFVEWWTNTSAIYPALDLLVHTSRSDGTSLVLLEAMACACPVAALGVGGVPEIVESEHTGLLAEAKNWANLAYRIVQLLDEPHRMQALGAAARIRVQKQFNLETNTRRTADELRRIAYQGMNSQPVPNSYMSGNGFDERGQFKNSAVNSG